MKEADEKRIWKFKKYMDSTPTSSYIPTINETAASNDEKAEIFKSTFFPPPPPADLSDIETADYPEPVPSPCESPYLKSKRRSKSSLRRKPPDQTKSLTWSSRNATRK